MQVFKEFDSPDSPKPAPGPPVWIWDCIGQRRTEADNTNTHCIPDGLRIDGKLAFAL